MEPFLKHRLAKLNNPNSSKNQKRSATKKNQLSTNNNIKKSDTNLKINGFPKSNNYKNLAFKSNAILNPDIYINNKANSLNSYINSFKNTQNLNTRANTGNFPYNLNKIIKENKMSNNKNYSNNKKNEVYNKKKITNNNPSTAKTKPLNSNKNVNMVNILNKKKNKNSLNLNNTNTLNSNKIKTNIGLKSNSNNKIVPGLKNNKKSLDNNMMKNNKNLNSFIPNIILNEISNKTYNNKTFNLNIINSNSNNYYNNTNINNHSNNIPLQVKTAGNTAITEYPSISNKLKIMTSKLELKANINKDDTNINYGKIKNSENKYAIYESDNVTVSYDKKSGNKIVNEFYFMETIGRGAYSKVKKCLNLKTKEEFAVKILNKRLLRKKKKSYGKTKEGTLKINYMIDDALNEITIYKSFQGTNKNVLKLYQILNDNKKDKTYLIMELAEKGPLVTLNEKSGVFCINSNYRDDIYDEKLVKTWIYDIANGLKFLHDNNVVHRDIKSDNILIDKNGHCKIADFGCSIKLKNGQADVFTKTEGNMYFFPPEFVDGKSKKQFGYKPVDVWAFGVSIYTCIFKTLPFLPENRENVVELFKEIREAKFDFKRNGIKISKEMETLLSHILDKDPIKRFTAKDILEYPWLKGE